MNSLMCSIIIPALNEEKHIKECLESITNQTLQRFFYEVIVVDNGSSDATTEIAQEYADEVHINVKGKVGAVRNYGAKIAKTDILVFLDSDCVLTKIG
ncbi:hypothetical protein CF392_15895 [Tamilnaduibacter salinus]|uniref:Glycosyltransferase 2-like domain-containing protein n=1 Tax=Tamilnaduibacter salinus TaxID=1484056 RepID=A0A2A2I0G6_9GAMM|nr:glycosyltransferase family A protein [Tamilnaduibacter salinus]PAV24503.1 hypothetical protein CF392_15895 [Tamilnaduibacter salinus]